MSLMFFKSRNLNLIVPRPLGWPEHQNQGDAPPYFQKDHLISLPIHFGSSQTFVHTIIPYILYVLYQNYIPQHSEMQAIWHFGDFHYHPFYCGFQRFVMCSWGVLGVFKVKEFIGYNSENFRGLETWVFICASPKLLYQILWSILRPHKWDLESFGGFQGQEIQW